jgi:hypothetical protein
MACSEWSRNNQEIEVAMSGGDGCGKPLWERHNKGDLTKQP